MAAAGSIAGIALGLLLARGLLAAFGGDLGGGYFSGARPPLSIDAAALAAFALLGILIGSLASVLPALEAVAAQPVAAMRSGSTEEALSKLARRWPALALAALGAALAAAPAVDGLPLPRLRRDRLPAAGGHRGGAVVVRRPVPAAAAPDRAGGIASSSTPWSSSNWLNKR